MTRKFSPSCQHTTLQSCYLPMSQCRGWAPDCRQCIYQHLHSLGACGQCDDLHHDPQPDLQINVLKFFIEKWKHGQVNWSCYMNESIMCDIFYLGRLFIIVCFVECWMVLPSIAAFLLWAQDNYQACCLLLFTKLVENENRNATHLLPVGPKKNTCFGQFKQQGF